MDRLQLLNDIKLPFAEVLGLKFTEASETGVKAEMVVRPELCTRPAILHGGAVMAFADTLGIPRRWPGCSLRTRASAARMCFGATRTSARRRPTCHRLCASGSPRCAVSATRSWRPLSRAGRTPHPMTSPQPMTTP